MVSSLIPRLLGGAGNEAVLIQVLVQVVGTHSIYASQIVDLSKLSAYSWDSV